MLTIREEQAFCLERMEFYRELAEIYRENNWKSMMADAYDTEKQWLWLYNHLTLKLGQMSKNNNH